MGYPAPYYESWDEMVATGRYWGMAPIHHGVFENGWRKALEHAARIVEAGGSAAHIRDLAIYTKEEES